MTPDKPDTSTERIHRLIEHCSIELHVAVKGLIAERDALQAELSRVREKSTRRKRALRETNRACQRWSSMYERLLLRQQANR